MNAFASELLKLRSVRGPLGLSLGMLAISGLAVVGTIGSGVLDGDADPALGLVSAVATGTGIFATLLGIIVVTSEYRHGTITPTFLVTPRRERVVAAKVAAGSVAGVALAAAMTVLAVAIAFPWLAAHDEALAFDGQLGLAVARLLATFVLAVVFGVAIGTVIHSQIGAIVATFGWFLILEGIVSLVAGYFTGFERDPLGPYLPGSLFGALSGGGEADQPGAPAALAFLLLYTGALLALGLVLTLRRDAD